MKVMLWRGVSRGRPIPALREREVEESPMVVVEPAALWWQEFERRTEMRSHLKVTMHYAYFSTNPGKNKGNDINGS